MEEIDKDSTEKSVETNQEELRPRVTEPDRTLGRYMIDEFKPKANASKEVPFEEINLDLYKPKAKLIGFKTSEQRISYWIQALIIRYVDYLNQQQEYKTTWEEIDSISHLGKPDRIKVSVYFYKEKLFVASVFVTTGRIQVQGQSYKRWSSTEFPLFLRLVDYLQEANTDQIQNDEFNALSSQSLFSTNRAEDDESSEDDDSSDDDSIEQENEEDSDCKEFESQDLTVDDKVVSNSLITNTLAELEVNFTQTKLNLENELKTIQDSLEQVLFMKDRIVRIENKYKASIENFDDKLHHNSSNIDDVNNKITDLTKQVKKLQDQRSSLLSNQSQMKEEIKSLKNENSGLKQELFVLREIVQKHENALESSSESHALESVSSQSALNLLSSHMNEQCQSNNSEIQSLTNPSSNPARSQSTNKSPTTAQSTSNQSNLKDPSLLLIDSNGKFLESDLLYPDNPVEIKRTYTLREVKDTINEYTTNPTAIIIHCGTNDLEKTYPDSVILQTKELLATTKARFPSSRIIYSSLLPRQDQLQNQVTKVNHELYNYCTSSNIAFVSHSHIQKPSQFYDNKHLNRHGVRFFAKNLKSALFGTPTKQSRDRRQNFDQQQFMLQPKEQPPVPRPQPQPSRIQRQAQVPIGRPSYATVASAPSSRGPLLATDQVMKSGLPNPLRTLIRQLQMFI